MAPPDPGAHRRLDGWRGGSISPGENGADLVVWTAKLNVRRGFIRRRRPGSVLNPGVGGSAGWLGRFPAPTEAAGPIEPRRPFGFLLCSFLPLGFVKR